jgi:hypothetical protein
MSECAAKPADFTGDALHPARKKYGIENNMTRKYDLT